MAVNRVGAVSRESGRVGRDALDYGQQRLRLILAHPLVKNYLTHLNFRGNLDYGRRCEGAHQPDGSDSVFL